jgi:hypothetical protein
MTGIGWTEAEIAEIRGEALAALQDEARILVRTDTPTKGGGQKETWSPAEGTVPCRVAPYSATRSGGEAAPSSGNRVEDRTKAWITVPVGTAVDNRDRIEVIGGKTYEIQEELPRVFDQFVMRLEGKVMF